jgi:hypothetical protein
MHRDQNRITELSKPKDRHVYSLYAHDIVRLLDCDDRSVEALLQSLPFSSDDTTAGTETELQAAVIGEKNDVDLPLIIEQSNYYANIMRRTVSGDTPKKLIADLDRFLNTNHEKVWENSYVRLPRSALSPFAYTMFRSDLRANKDITISELRTDAHKFVIKQSGEQFLRIPVSYLLKLALADVVSFQSSIPRIIQKTGYELTRNFTNDNTSPETHSFHVVKAKSGEDIGKAIGKDISRRFLLSQLLVMYANKKFLLSRYGQQAILYFSPHPPLRQKKLNACISDAFYRELFMSPCLSGWNDGEAKHNYMHLCHEVLSRSHLNAVVKLRDAGILLSNLAILPTISNTSLANNGTHVSLGSKKLSRLFQDSGSGFTRYHEKYLGDLVVKVFEHFLPLFVGTYSAAPYRFDFGEFHPETVLGFLPHELDYTHLRMLWRRWKKKTKMKVFNQPITPSGVPWLDTVVGRVFGLKGDIVPDFRLIDYLVCLMSTYSSPALNGRYGNSVSLKKDLADLGIFNTQMSLYLFYKLREYNVMGFSGFEGRHYSLFESFHDDMGRACSLQNFITALAFKYIVSGELTHNNIPDDPFIESERRQIIFCAALGIPTFYVRSDTKNLFMKRIFARTQKVRSSRRYPGYVRVELTEYRKALIDILAEDGAPLIEMLGIGTTIKDLKNRINNFEEFSVAPRLIKGILKSKQKHSPLNMDSDAFNSAAENYYRGDLKRSHMLEALLFLKEDCRMIDKGILSSNDSLSKTLRFILNDSGAMQMLDILKDDVVEERVSLEHLTKLIHLVLVVEYIDQLAAKHEEAEDDPAPVYRTGNP